MDRAESTLSSLNMNNLVHKELQGEDGPSLLIEKMLRVALVKEPVLEDALKV